MYLTIDNQTDAHRLQVDLGNLAKWEKRWQMQFHPDKCQVLRITNKRKPTIFNYTLHDHVLATVTQAKYLGVTITNNLNWKQHVENITKSANKALGFLRRNLRIHSVKAKEQAYLTYVRPIYIITTLLLSRASEDGAPILDDRASRAHASLPLGFRHAVTG